jgi:hypothetical protein
MGNVVDPNATRDRVAHGRRKVEAPRQGKVRRFKVLHIDSIEIDGLAQSDIGVAIAVDIRGDDVDFMSPRRQGTAESMDSIDRSSVPRRR